NITKTYARTLTIESLEGGNCWVGSENGETFFSEDDFEGIKIVSFPQERSYVLEKASFNDLHRNLESTIKKVGISDFSEVPYDLYVKCSYDGMMFLLNLYGGEVKLCAHLSIVEKSNENSNSSNGINVLNSKSGKKISNIGIGNFASFKIDKIYPNHELQKGACIGQKPGKLILNLSKEYVENSAIVEKCVEILKDEYLNLVKIYSNENIKGMYIIQLHADYYYKEHLVKNLILQQNVCDDLIKSESIEYDGIFMNVGSTHKVYSGTFPGF
ncbi:MAG: hypothetical protein HQK51_19205, partial [Oligoflexia bacterium]|nr:hypothetical protein [Oligoflexia bacterium]